MHSLDASLLAVVALGAIALGIFLLIKGGEVTIDSAVRVAEKSGLSKMFIAATVIAFGTSAPELFTSINANLSGYPGISVGNVIGSNITNVLLVVGVSALILPLDFETREARVDAMVMLAATAAMVPAVFSGFLPRWGGVVMLLGIASYIACQYKASRLDTDEVDAVDGTGRNPYLMLVAGIAILLVGSEILVRGAVAGGMVLGVPEAVIGMTVIAFGTSLPELITCVAAASKRQFELIIGGIVGSNIFNILSVLALTALIKPVLIAPRFATFDLPIMLAVTVLFSIFLLLTGRVSRLAGGAMLAGYLVFVVFQYSFFGPLLADLR